MTKGLNLLLVSFAIVGIACTSAFDFGFDDIEKAKEAQDKLKDWENSVDFDTDFDFVLVNLLQQQ